MELRFAVCCPDDARHVFSEGIRMYTEKRGLESRGAYFDCHEQFVDGIVRNNSWDLLIIAEEGARGMESVISARELIPETPVLWCSDDDGFAVASYRYRCSLFMKLPSEGQEVESAIGRCLAS